jgi:hypothetical protein
MNYKIYSLDFKYLTIYVKIKKNKVNNKNKLLKHLLIP